MSVLGSLMEKLQHAGSSTCLLHTVEQGGGVSDTAELRDGVSQAGGASSLCWGAFSVGGAVSFGVHSLLERYFSLQAEISGRQKLGTVSVHIVHICTWTKRGDFAVSPS